MMVLRAVNSEEGTLNGSVLFRAVNIKSTDLKILLEKNAKVVLK